MTRTNLTERYIAATIRSLPQDAQGDVRDELQASIDDAVEARVDEGEDRADAERAVLNGLGDPAALAAGYADRPLHLIGPRYFLTWWRLLKLLLIILPLCAAGGVALGQALNDAPIGEIFAQAITVALAVIVHVAFWVTLVFAVLERTSGSAPLPSWNVDQLPEPQASGAGRADLIASLVFLGLAAAAIVWDHLRGAAYVGDQWISVLNPALWPWTIAALFALMAAEAALAIAVYAYGGWTRWFAVANTVLAVLVASLMMTLLVRGDLVNPQFLQEVFLGSGVEPDVVRILAVLLGFGIVAVAVWDVIDGWLKARRARR
ncbi:MAG: permease prefix domain 1-containing protein [Gemmatimonadota bacterium]|nr:permease prefix domain 1-containing protein [Gemmatimonadota bacterium]